MSDDLQNLYQEMVVDHSRKPRNFRTMEDPTRTAEGFNRLCGDRLTLYVKLSDGRIQDISFQGAGCAISNASASLLTVSVKGKTPEEAAALFKDVHRMLTEGRGSEAQPRDLGKLEALSGVWEFPSRVKCATLAWQVLVSALEERQEITSTER